MKWYKTGLRGLITAGSIAGFLGGWALFAHSPKPVDAQSQSQPNPVQPVEIPQLQPIPSLGGFDNNVQAFPSAPQTGFFRPRMRTGGS